MSIYLSGSVGYTLLKLNNIYILLLADIHDGIEYCTQDSTMISDWLDNVSSNNNNTILLEEIIREKFKLTDLWPNARHTQELKKLNQGNKMIIPVDIRPMLIPFSWELVSTNKKLGETRLLQYIQPLEDFFNKNTNFYNNYIKNNVDIMETKQNQYTDSKISPSFHFNQLSIIFVEFKNENENIMNKNISEIIDINIIVLQHINNLISMIMEWYIILLIYSNNNNSIIHVGLAHSNRLLDLLVKVYRFKIIEQSGLNKMVDIPNHIPSSCILLPQDINNMYNKQYGFNL